MAAARGRWPNGTIEPYPTAARCARPSDKSVFCLFLLQRLRLFSWPQLAHSTRCVSVFGQARRVWQSADASCGSSRWLLSPGAPGCPRVQMRFSLRLVRHLSSLRYTVSLATCGHPASTGNQSHRTRPLALTLAPFGSCLDTTPSGTIQYLEEDPRTNRIDDSLQLFTAICSNKLLSNAALVLMLNKARFLLSPLSPREC